MIIWENEWAKFWLWVVNNLKQRWLEDVMIASNDFLKQLEQVYPKVEIQLCIIYQIRNSTKYISWKDIKEFMKVIFPNDVSLEKSMDLAMKNITKKWS